MAIKFQYNKISLQEMQKQLKVRLDALPVIKYKEAILRTEAEKAKRLRLELERNIENKIKQYEYMNILWQEFPQDVMRLEWRNRSAARSGMLRRFHHALDSIPYSRAHREPDLLVYQQS